MTDPELNAAAAELLGIAYSTDTPFRWRTDPKGDLRTALWSPATEIEHAWIVQQACDPQLFAIALRKLRPVGEWEDVWLATAPPRARTEAAAVCLTSKGEAT